MGIKLSRLVRAVASAGMSEVLYEPNKEGIADFFGKEDRRQAENYANQADADYAQAQGYQQQALGIANQQRQAQQAMLDADQKRYDELYAPMEQSIVSELNNGSESQQAALEAGQNFASQYDAELANREREKARLGINYRAGSTALRTEQGNDAFDRARGIASSQTQARREADDANFLKKTQFFNSNGNALQNRLSTGLSNMYGAEYNAYNNAAGNANANRDYNQSISNQYNQNSTGGINLLTNVAGTAASIYTGGVQAGMFGAKNKTGDAATPNLNSATGMTVNKQASSIAGSIQSDINRT